MQSLIRAFFLCALVVLSASSALAQEAWELNRGECETILPSPSGYDLAQVRNCAQLWESYRDVTDLPRAEAERVAPGFNRLFFEGSRADQSLARAALGRLGLEPSESAVGAPQTPAADPLAPLDSTATDSGPAVGGRRDTSTIEVGRSSRRARDRADDRNEDGMEAYESGDYDDAAREFEAALEADPWHLLAKYNLACQYALLGRTDDAIEVLDELSRWDHEGVPERMARARVDADFVPLRDDPRFREVTGYLRAQVLNGAGEEGVEPTTAVRDALVAEGIDVSSFGNDRHHRARPLVYYRPGQEERAEEARAALARDDTALRTLDWDSEFDLIVVFGDIALLAEDSVPTPLVQGTYVGTLVSGDPEQTIEEVQGAGEEALEWEPPEE